MSLALDTASTSMFLRGLNSLSGLIDRAVEAGLDEATLIEARLAPDIEPSLGGDSLEGSGSSSAAGARGAVTGVRASLDHSHGYGHGHGQGQQQQQLVRLRRQGMVQEETIARLRGKVRRSNQGRMCSSFQRKFTPSEKSTGGVVGGVGGAGRGHGQPGARPGQARRGGGTEAGARGQGAVRALTEPASSRVRCHLTPGPRPYVHP